MRLSKLGSYILTLLAVVHAIDKETSDYPLLIGSGIYDITGPAAQVHIQGYGKSSQSSNGIHMRLRSRAFIVASVGSNGAKNPQEVAHDIQQLRFRKHRVTEKARDSAPAPLLADPERTVCFVSADILCGSDLLTLKVAQRLEQLLPQQHGSKKRLCHLENLSISGTHTHSASGGFLQYAVYQITSLGFSDEAMDAYAEGIAQSIHRAYSKLTRCEITVAEDLLFDSNINRSPSSYLLNPVEERKRYENIGDTDKRMLQLRFTTAEKDIGILNWFSVHGTSLNNTNQLLSGDNKGYASYLMEKHQNGDESMPGNGSFVAAFASTNLGDVSPNTNGPRCVDTGLPCDVLTSSCGGAAEKCIASGPGEDMFESAQVIGRKQFDMALALLHSNKIKKLKGEVSFRHSFVNVGNLTVVLEDGTTAKTCPAALGYSFAAGTTDGPGQFDFTQGRNSSNGFWNMIAAFLSKPTPKQVQCHHPKPILLNTGEATQPYDWDPNTIPISIFRIGDLFILNVPSELTTMAGRRLRQAMTDTITSRGVTDPIITIAGLANSYTHYVTTFEEYTGQRYEAASTLYGPHTLAAYIQEFNRIMTDLLNGDPSSTSDPPRDLSSQQISLIPPVLVDTVEFGKEFGSVIVEPEDEYTRGQDAVFVSFRSANPRNNRRPQGTFLTVDKMLADNNKWKTMYVDGDWCTKFVWNGDAALFGISFAEIHWQIPPDTPLGQYRICHFGARKTLFSEAEALLGFEAPEWLSSSTVGSALEALLSSGVKLFHSICQRLGSCVEPLQVERSRIIEFSGCSRPFLVKEAGATPTKEFSE
ncbi:Neutral ceramidase [Seminavis robusta]|uniref:Neutral ceramidase n=1 Tax=Seminavis robusta TaxID=568900 RepID=A0A9N8HJ13_9STRA|nr:Neutral ceramidase [Seminavis robusta]|eukprot:Sro627_g177930.1 Neutral ceramidase (814) ;mRNA; f:44700-47745